MKHGTNKEGKDTRLCGNRSRSPLVPLPVVLPVCIIFVTERTEAVGP